MDGIAVQEQNLWDVSNAPSKIWAPGPAVSPLDLCRGVQNLYSSRSFQEQIVSYSTTTYPDSWFLDRGYVAQLSSPGKPQLSIIKLISGFPPVRYVAVFRLSTLPPYAEWSRKHTYSSSLL